MKEESQQRSVVTVSQLNREARVTIEQRFSQVWVTGELSNFARPRSEHWYFTLKDDGAQVRCAMFANRNMRVSMQPGDGQQVRIDDNTGEPNDTMTKLVADALRLTRLDAPMETPDAGERPPDMGITPDQGVAIDASAATQDFATAPTRDASPDALNGALEDGGTPFMGATGQQTSTRASGGCTVSGGEDSSAWYLLAIFALGLRARRRSPAF